MKSKATSSEGSDMTITSIFEKDINRQISGVVKVQDTDETKAWTVLDEYVVTPEIERLLSLFFNAYNGSIDKQTDDIGCWISGFFGSGKSHFLEIINHLLSNKPIPNPEGQETKSPLDFFKEKKLDSFLLADISRAAALETDTVIFNIDAKAEAKDGDYAILNVFVRVFNSLQGFYEKNQWVAELERRLTSDGVFEQFQNAFQKATNKAWKENRDAVLLNRPHIVKALTEVLPKLSAEDAAAWIEELKSKHGTSPEEFAKLVKSYLDSQGKKSRIVFLVDEVGQFIGNNTSKMLQLQTITEQLGITCKGRAWVIVTSQEDVDKVIGYVNESRTNDFSKIQGRFKTRLSLSSANVDEVIKLRILKKTEAATKTLSKTYTENEAVLKNLLAFSGEGVTMPFFRDGADFAATYPFVPYQFQVLQQVYSTIRRTGATGQHLAHGERSMINAFQLAARQVSSDTPSGELGKVVPFYCFYESIENSLEGAIKATITRAANDKTLTSAFDVCLLKLLFLLRSLDREVPPTVENLATLCVDNINADKLELRTRIEASLARLEKQNFIRRNDDLYFFLSDQEQEIEREIQHTEVDSTRTAKKLFSLIFEDAFDVKSSFTYKPLKRVYEITRRCDNYSADRQGDDLSFTVVSPLYDGYSDFAGRPEQVSMLHEGTALLILEQDKSFDTEFNVWLKTDKFSETPRSTQSPERDRIIQEIIGINNNRRDRLKKLLEPLILSSRVYIAGKEWKGNLIKKPKDIYEQAANYLIENTYSKLGLIRGTTEDFEKELHLILTESDASNLFKDNIPHPQATETIKIYILTQSGKAPLLADIVDRFERKPYGWKDVDIVLIVARLVIRGDLELRTDAPLLPREAIPYLSKKPYWKNVRVAGKQKVSSEVLRAVQTVCKEWFQKTAPNEENQLFSVLREELQKLHDKLISDESSAIHKGYPGLKVISEGKRLTAALLELKEQAHLFSAIAEKKAEIQSFRDAYQDIADFYNYQISNWDQLQQIIGRAKLNEPYLALNEQAQEVLKKVQSILTIENPFSQLKDSFNLSKQFETIETTMLQEIRSISTKQLQESLTAVQSVLSENSEKLKVASEQFLAPLKKLQDEIQSSAIFSAIEVAGLKAKEVAAEQARRIREAIEGSPEKVHGEKPQGSASGQTAQHIRLSTLQPLGKALTNADDVNEFIDRVQGKLIEAVKKGPVFLD
jgi:hypothetical protein